MNQKALRSSEFVFAPPAGLEPATGTLTRSSILLIEDTICLLRARNRNRQGEELRRSRLPIYNFALVAFALNGQ